jgi:photosystem II stability/assembly factor-like uncharacterized protein
MFMFRLLIASTLMLTAAFSMAAAVNEESGCRIQDASVAGDTLRLLCEQGKVRIESEDLTDGQEVTLPPGNELLAIRFLDADRGFVAGENGTLLATDDGGRSWRTVTVPAEEHLTDIHSVGESLWIAGWNGAILHSADGGRTWSRQSTGVSQGLEDVYFIDSEHGWAVGWVGSILRTTDGGATWTQAQTQAADWSFHAVYFRDASDGWAVGFGGQILRSRDGGVNWEAQTSPVTDSLTAVWFDDSGRGWITATDGLLTTTDDGATWSHVEVDSWLFLHKLLEFDGSVWAIGPDEALRQNGSELTWQKVDIVPPVLPEVDSSRRLEETASSSEKS